MSKVFIHSASDDYEYQAIKVLVFEMLASIKTKSGTPPKGPDTKVLIKPNLLMPAEPELAITTHPLIVKAVCEYFLDHGIRPRISDSPAISNFRKIRIRGGYEETLEDLGIDIKPFQKGVKVDIGEPFGEVEIARAAMEADLVINLAKLKSHTQMLLTLGVKNTFGCILGMQKAKWHLRAGVDREMFARLLVQIHGAVNPAFTIVDGILALEGQGPGKSGSARPLGLLVGGNSAHAVDKTICILLGLDPNELETVKQASALKAFDGEAYVSGDLKIQYDFKFPRLGPLSFGGRTVNRFMRRHGIQRPVADNRMCKLCGECWKICPAKVIDHNIKGVKIEYRKCIRCYCCIEVCPHGAIIAKEPLLGKVIRGIWPK
jgi:uncharacterized protein (DUF362 family)/Pyruvate/2-oxoacid:ferredoxin oxidoreductase delta subunit